MTLLLLSLVILGMMYVIAALIDRDQDSIDRIFRKSLFVQQFESIVMISDHLCKHWPESYHSNQLFNNYVFYKLIRVTKLILNQSLK